MTCHYGYIFVNIAMIESLESFINRNIKNFKLGMDPALKLSILVLKPRLKQPLTKQCPLVDIQIPIVEAIHKVGCRVGSLSM